LNFREDIEYKEIRYDETPAKRGEYWQIGKGLQAPDNLPTSKYLDEIIEDISSGKYDTKSGYTKLAEHYNSKALSEADFATLEGDLVTARIAELLESFSFTMSPSTLMGIHRRLFEDIPSLIEYRPGKLRTSNFSKEEPVLNGESVSYADHGTILDNWRYDFEQEKTYRYSIPFKEADLTNLANFTVRIWGTHGFYEGNTRTVAVFLILYLRSMGIEADNSYFKEFSNYFRDALVRSSFTNIAKGVFAEPKYLGFFFENILWAAGHDLSKQDLSCSELLDK